MSDLRLSLNEASLDQIRLHLQGCDGSFVPRLSERVLIQEYARKIHEYARRFECWKGPELAGLLAAYFNESTVFITNLSVLPPFRGSGISRRLLDQCRFTAMESNCHVLELEVDARNIIAVGIYKKYGFEEARLTDFTVVMRLIVGC